MRELSADVCCAVCVERGDKHEGEEREVGEEQDVKLTVLDSSSVSDVSKIVAEDADASCVTIIFKSASFGITQRKWRLRLKSTAAASKFLSDIRNVKDM